MEIKIVDSTPSDVRLFEGVDYPAKLNPTDIVEIFQTPLTGTYNWDYSPRQSHQKTL